VFKARGDLEHPALSDDPAWEPGSATVTEPIPVGLTETGTQATLVVFDDTGARHTLIGGMKGSGKSGFESDMIAGLARCRDVVIWAIDVQKGAQFATHWGVGDGGCIDRVATSRAQATRMFAAAREIIRDRATERANDPHATSDKHIPTPDRPALAIIVDEAADLLNVGDVDAVESARSTTTSGRSEAVSVTLATQRPTVPSVGDGDLKAQLDNAVGLKMRKSSDVRFVFPDDAESFDTSLFRRPGMCFIGDGEAAPIPARTWALYRPPVVRRIAAKLAPGRPKLDAHAEAIAAKWLDGPTAPPLHSATTGASDQVDTGNNRRPGKPDVDQLRAKLQQQEAAAIEAAETDPPLPETPMSELARPAEVPEDLVDQAAAVLAELSAAGIKSDDTNARILARVRAAGTGRVQTRDLVAAAGLHRSRVQDRINALVAAGLIRAAGRGHWTAVPAAPTDEAAAQ
jgi:S-DNA-T family DNA segregation ATPase FtsK/SpoIIIE